jgi:hypothetical protein
VFGAGGRTLGEEGKTATGGREIALVARVNLGHEDVVVADVT